MQSPLIDILVPTYEPDPLFLKAAIESALAQTNIRWQMFIHDDASTVDVRAIIEPYLTDERITFTRSSKRLGIGGNWNACLGIALAKPGPSSIQFLFQDDLWEPHYLARMLDALEKNPTAGFASADHTYDCDDSPDSRELYDAVAAARKKIAAGLHEGEILLTEWIKKELHPNIIGEPSFVMLKREQVQTVGLFREDMPQFLDVEYWIRCLIIADWCHVTENLGTFRVHGGGASAQNQTSGAGIYDRLRCFETLIRLLPEGDVRKAVIRARGRALDDMARKFLKRLGNKQSIPAKGTGGMAAFALKHPFLISKSLWKALFTTR